MPEQNWATFLCKCFGSDLFYRVVAKWAIARSLLMMSSLTAAKGSSVSISRCCVVFVWAERVIARNMTSASSRWEGAFIRLKEGSLVAVLTTGGREWRCALYSRTASTLFQHRFLSRLKVRLSFLHHILISSWSVRRDKWHSVCQRLCCFNPWGLLIAS